ncbi:GNAT family N-acetyltransferase [Pseudoroseomonas globiformis]|uniref:GNAT family N-acetyltransferase n=1 Tax=Teichococcus globiformis TaxID=2307229 RepID=A0ABV7FYG2_9PROT
MSHVLEDIIGLTGRQRPSEPAFVLASYILNPSGIRCSVAVDDKLGFLGFQSLIRASAGNRYGVAEGWGIIGTNISPYAHRQGVGAALFRVSSQAAVEAGIAMIDASIGTNNPGALQYYEAIGFRTYREQDGVIGKVFAVPRQNRSAGEG